MVPMKCDFCESGFKRIQKKVKSYLKLSPDRKQFCSLKCSKLNNKNGQNLKCEQCSKEFYKQNYSINTGQNHFCSQSCSAIYNNSRKTKGTRVSKLELYLAKNLTLLYPDLEFHFNKKDAINSELDIYIPSLKLAFELNGIFHYEPIYGDEKLNQIQNNDNRKFQACLEKGIELCIIDTSSQKYFKEQNSVKYLLIIGQIINIKSGS